MGNLLLCSALPVAAASAAVVPVIECGDSVCVSLCSAFILKSCRLYVWCKRVNEYQVSVICQMLGRTSFFFLCTAVATYMLLLYVTLRGLFCSLLQTAVAV